MRRYCRSIDISKDMAPGRNVGPQRGGNVVAILITEIEGLWAELVVQY